MMYPVATSLLAPSAMIRTTVAWILCATVSLAIFMAPALWNGFALVFFDTGGYAARILEMTLAPGRSFFYGLFLWTTSLFWWSFWGPVLAQSVAALWLVHLTLRCHDLANGPVATTVFCVGLGVSTGISWYISQLMPDALVPLTVLALWLLGFSWHKLGWNERGALAALTLLGLLSHMSCLALALGLVAVTLMAQGVLPRCGWSLPVFSLAPAALVAASLVVMPMLHLVLVGKAVYTPGGPTFIFGRLVQDGIAQRWLAEHCPAPGIKLCALQNRIPKTADDFLWNENSPFHDIGGWSGTADAELGYLVKECVKSYPGMVVWTSLRATVEQMTRVATGDGFDEFQTDTRGIFTIALPRTADAFNAARQQQNQITRPLFAALNAVYIPVAHFSLLGLLVVAGWGVRARRHDLAGIALFTLLALWGNAFICGALSNPHDRYQSRLVWLAPLVVGMAVLGWWQGRSKKGSGRGKTRSQAFHVLK